MFMPCDNHLCGRSFYEVILQWVVLAVTVATKAIRLLIARLKAVTVAMETIHEKNGTFGGKVAQ